MKRASAHVVPLRDYLSEHWITAQIRYHEDTARRQGAWDSRLFAATGVLFLITAVAAFLHLLGWGERHHNPTGFGLLLIVLSICVPAIGGAVHGIRRHAVPRRGADHFSPPRPSSLPRRDLQLVTNRLVSLQQHQSVDRNGVEASGDGNLQGNF